MKDSPLTGFSFSKDTFRFAEDLTINPEFLLKVLNGDMAGCIFRHIISPEICTEIAKNFWSSPSLTPRGDNVPAYYVGTYHYEKNLFDYLDEVQKTQSVIESLFNNTQNIFELFINTLSEHLKQFGIQLKLANYKGRAAAKYLMRSWSNEGNYALKPHEDMAQCKSLKQRGFEIQEVVNFQVIAVNICIENLVGGDLIYWNIQPDNKSRSRLGVIETGYPYPSKLLTPCEKITIAVKIGDIYCFNGKNIHAVSSTQSTRSTLSFFMGFRDKSTVIYWA